MKLATLSAANRSIWTIIGLTIGVLILAVIALVLIKFVGWLVLFVLLAGALVFGIRRLTTRG